ncbi:molybdenum cofactor guanylyltransferase [Candidatus Bathyarchaeota archaeon]|nr:molybdenum cofactor guanylyltransferase [Candidatus Bathyarchaeota archaeon]
MRSAIVLAGGSSTRAGGDKGLRLLGGEPLVNHVINAVDEQVDEVIVVVASEPQAEKYRPVVKKNSKVVMDMYSDGSPLVGLLSGLSHCGGSYALTAACDMPFISEDAVGTLFREAEGHDGAVYEKPNGWIEPLVAVYRVDSSLEEARRLYCEGDLRVRMIFMNLGDVVRIPVERLREVDPELLTLFDADTEDKFIEAERLLKRGFRMGAA